MEKVCSDYPEKIRNRAVELFNKQLEGKRLYRVEAIPAILRFEFPDHNLKKLSRGTIYFWLNRYDVYNYRVGREKKK